MVDKCVNPDYGSLEEGEAVGTGYVINTADVLKRLQQLRGGRILICELCGGTQWRGGDVITVYTKQDGQQLSGMTIGGPYLAFMVMACHICGNSKFYNLVRLGFVPSSSTGQQPSENPDSPADVDKMIDEALGPETA